MEASDEGTDGRESGFHTNGSSGDIHTSYTDTSSSTSFGNANCSIRIQNNSNVNNGELNSPEEGISTNVPQKSATESSNVPQSSGTESSNVPQSSGTDSSNVFQSSGTESSNVPQSSGTESSNVPQSSGTDSYNVSQKSATDSPIVPQKPAQDSPVVPKSSVTHSSDNSYFRQISATGSPNVPQKPATNSPNIPQSSVTHSSDNSYVPQSSATGSSDSSNVPQTSATDIPNIPESSAKTSPNFPQKSATDSYNVSQKLATDSPIVPQKPAQDSPVVPKSSVTHSSGNSYFRQISATGSPNVPQNPATNSPNFPQSSATDSYKVPQSSVSDSPSIPQSSATDSPNIPQISATDRYNFPQSSATDSCNISQSSLTDSPSIPQSSATDSPNIPQISATDRYDFPQSSATDSSDSTNDLQKSATDSPNIPESSATDSPHVPQSLATDSSHVPQKSATDSPSKPSSVDGKLKEMIKQNVAKLSSKPLTLADLISYCRSQGLQVYNDQYNVPKSERTPGMDARERQFSQRPLRSDGRHSSKYRRSGRGSHEKNKLPVSHSNFDNQSGNSLFATASPAHYTDSRLHVRADLVTTLTIRDRSFASGSTSTRGSPFTHRSKYDLPKAPKHLSTEDWLQQLTRKRSRRRRRQENIPSLVDLILVDQKKASGSAVDAKAGEDDIADPSLETVKNDQAQPEYLSASGSASDNKPDDGNSANSTLEPVNAVQSLETDQAVAELEASRTSPEAKSDNKSITPSLEPLTDKQRQETDQAAADLEPCRSASHIKVDDDNNGLHSPGNDEENTERTVEKQSASHPNGLHSPGADQGKDEEVTNGLTSDTKADDDNTMIPSLETSNGLQSSRDEVISNQLTEKTYSSSSKTPENKQQSSSILQPPQDSVSMVIWSGKERDVKTDLQNTDHAEVPSSDQAGVSTESSQSKVSKDNRYNSDKVKVTEYRIKDGNTTLVLYGVPRSKALKLETKVKMTDGTPEKNVDKSKQKPTTKGVEDGEGTVSQATPDHGNTVHAFNASFTYVNTTNIKYQQRVRPPTKDTSSPGVDKDKLYVEESALGNASAIHSKSHDHNLKDSNKPITGCPSPELQSHRGVSHNGLLQDVFKSLATRENGKVINIHDHKVGDESGAIQNLEKNNKLLMIEKQSELSNIAHVHPENNRQVSTPRYTNRDIKLPDGGLENNVTGSADKADTVVDETLHQNRSLGRQILAYKTIIGSRDLKAVKQRETGNDDNKQTSHTVLKQHGSGHDLRRHSGTSISIEVMETQNLGVGSGNQPGLKDAHDIQVHNGIDENQPLKYDPVTDGNKSPDSGVGRSSPDHDEVIDPSTGHVPVVNEIRNDTEERKLHPVEVKETTEDEVMNTRQQDENETRRMDYSPQPSTSKGDGDFTERRHQIPSTSQSSGDGYVIQSPVASTSHSESYHTAQTSPMTTPSATDTLQRHTQSPVPSTSQSDISADRRSRGRERLREIQARQNVKKSSSSTKLFLLMQELKQSYKEEYELQAKYLNQLRNTRTKMKTEMKQIRNGKTPVPEESEDENPSTSVQEPEPERKKGDSPEVKKEQVPEVKKEQVPEVKKEKAPEVKRGQASETKKKQVLAAVNSKQVVEVHQEDNLKPKPAPPPKPQKDRYEDLTSRTPDSVKAEEEYKLKSRPAPRVDCRWDPEHPLYHEIKTGFKSKMKIPDTRSVSLGLKSLKKKFTSGNIPPHNVYLLEAKRRYPQGFPENELLYRTNTMQSSTKSNFGEPPNPHTSLDSNFQYRRGFGKKFTRIPVRINMNVSQHGQQRSRSSPRSDQNFPSQQSEFHEKPRRSRSLSPKRKQVERRTQPRYDEMDDNEASIKYQKFMDNRVKLPELGQRNYSYRDLPRNRNTNSILRQRKETQSFPAINFDSRGYSSIGTPALKKMKQERGVKGRSANSDNIEIEDNFYQDGDEGRAMGDSVNYRYEDGVYTEEVITELNLKTSSKGKQPNIGRHKGFRQQVPLNQAVEIAKHRKRFYNGQSQDKMAMPERRVLRIYRNLQKFRRFRSKDNLGHDVGSSDNGPGFYDNDHSSIDDVLPDGTGFLLMNYDLPGYLDRQETAIDLDKFLQKALVSGRSKTMYEPNKVRRRERALNILRQKLHVKETGFPNKAH